MTQPTSAPDSRGPTLAGFRAGVIASMSLLPGVFFFGAAFGALAAQKGLTFVEALAITTVLYAGASQFAAMDVWPKDWSFGGVLAVAAIVGVVNVRLFLMSAALRPWLQNLPASFLYPQFQLLTDLNYVVAVRYRAEGGNDAGALFGAGFAAWAVWTISVIPGYALGALVSNSARFGLDLVMPIMFAAMVAPLWKSHRDTRDWMIAGAAALALMTVAPSHWVILGGAAAGMLSAAFLHRDEKDQ